MSKKNLKKNPQTKKAAGQAKEPVKKSTKIIIAAVAAVVVIAAVLIGIFVVKPAIDDKKDTPFTSFSGVEQNENERYEYVEYKGMRMAKPVAEILVQAEKDSKASAKKHGVVCTIGDWEISRSEFELTYLDQYSAKLYEVQYAIQQRGSNVTGYEPEILPTEQKYPQGDITWADKFAADTIDSLKTYYTTFDAAIEANIALTEVEIDNLISSYERINDYILNTDKTLDEYVASIYGEGVTYAIFARREIVQTYAEKFEQLKTEEYSNSLTENELQKTLDKDPHEYTAIKARVYPIQAEYDAVELSQVNTEKEFLEFAKKNNPEEDYNAEVLTQCFYATRGNLASAFGDEVAYWAFDSRRVPGEVGLVQGQLYQYLVYIESLPTYINSHEVLVYNYAFSGGESTEQVEKIYYEVEEYYNKVKGKEVSPEEFQEVFNATANGCYQISARAGDFYFEVANWILDGERKSGDMEMFADSENGVYVIYYINSNTDDPDWKYYMRTALSTQKYISEYEARVAEYGVKENTEIIQDAFEAGNVIISARIEKSKQENQ